MNVPRKALLACLAAVAGLLVLQPVLSASSPPRPQQGGSPGARPPGGPGQGGQRPSYPGSQRPGHAGGQGQSRHYGHSGGHSHYGGSYWGWGLALGIPLGLGWYDSWWGPGYYPSYAYGPVYPGYGYGYGYGNPCGWDEDCWRERQSRSEPTPPTTEVAPAAPGEEGGPTQRPLHLNYCDSARAWFPHVRTCPGGWRMIRPEYSRDP